MVTFNTFGKKYFGLLLVSFKYFWILLYIFGYESIFPVLRVWTNMAKNGRTCVGMATGKVGEGKVLCSGPGVTDPILIIFSITIEKVFRDTFSIII